MADYLAVLAREGGPEALGAYRALERSLGAAGWRLERGVAPCVWTSGAPPLPLASVGGVTVIGEAFDLRPRPSTPTSDEPSWPPPLWGGYVAIGGSASAPQLYRDPSGALAAHVWRHGGLLLAGSTLFARGLAPVAPCAQVRRDAVARWLVDPCELATTPGLDGVVSVAPGGSLQVVNGALATRQLWTPATIVRAAMAESTQAAAGRLRAAMDAATEAYGGLGRPLAAEVSGGLDSAIVAASLARSARLGALLHMTADPPEADERRFARAVAQRLDQPLIELAIDQDDDLRADDLAEFATTPLPPVNALDRPYDAAVAAALQTADTWGLATGQGGDAVFLKLCSPVLATRIAGERGWAAVLDAEVQELAARLRTSVWRLVSAARRARRMADPWPSWSPIQGSHPDLVDLRSGGPRHPWLLDLDEVEPAKRLQVVGLGYALLNQGVSRRARAARQIHVPLLQPVMEAGLRIPADRLAPAGRDRALARETFRDRLPPEVYGRTGKGDLTAVYARRMTRSLPFLRDWLLGGRLRDLTLLDSPSLDAQLTEDALFYDARFGDLLKLAAIEAWLREMAER